MVQQHHVPTWSGSGAHPTLHQGSHRWAGTSCQVPLIQSVPCCKVSLCRVRLQLLCRGLAWASARESRPQGPAGMQGRSQDFLVPSRFPRGSLGVQYPVTIKRCLPSSSLSSPQSCSPGSCVKHGP